ncbi:LD-carboxypeptidase [Thalassobacillus sp. CUG 92003]|uniref:S66 peptidase family protein n=1 Tax=Thalassobacillus sp. CUG 92003 TaxID=2736641 RepID=UPI0015E66022|nr:LD-carboxypeptidase [Thalassobacillus sp. CUG 92003]
MILPKKLNAGDTIGVIAPASPPNMEQTYRATQFFEQLGLHVRLGKHISRVKGYLAGSKKHRLRDFHEMVADPAIKGIFCAGGGYGSGQLVDEIDYRLVRQNPKIIWGYSDITFLLTALRLKSELVTFHGPMLGSDIGKRDFHDLSKQSFNQLFSPQVLHYDNTISDLWVLSKGEATGKLVGGNLSLIVQTLGTDYEIDCHNALLLIEDIDEEPYRIDGMLNQLRLAGKLADAAGVVVGDFKNPFPTNEKPSLTLQEVLYEYLAHLHKPVMGGFLIGHCQPHFSVPLGIQAELSTVKQSLRIQPGVRNN